MTDVIPLTCVLNRACGSTDRTPSATAAIILASCGQRCASSHAIRPVSDIPINSATEVRPGCTLHVFIRFDIYDRAQLCMLQARHSVGLKKEGVIDGPCGRSFGACQA